MVVASVLMVVLVGCARRFPRSWPAVAGGTLGVLVLAGSFAYPVVVEPLNHFTSLPNGHLRTEVFALADRRGPDRRRARRGRLAAHDDAERLRLRLRRHPACGALRQPGRRRAGGRRSRWSPTGLSPCPARRRADRVAASVPPEHAASGCSRWSSVRWGSDAGVRMRDPVVVPMALALIADRVAALAAGARTASAT